MHYFLKHPPSKGAALLFAVAVVGVVFFAAMTVSLLLTGQLKIAGDIKESAIAFAAADAAVERALFDIYRGAVRETGGWADTCFDPNDWFDLSDATACYRYDVPDNVRDPLDEFPDCGAAPTAGCVQGFGVFRGVSRALQVSF